MIQTIPPSLNYIPEDNSSLKKFGITLNDLWKTLSRTLNPWFLSGILYTPVVTSGTGAFTTVSSSGRYLQFGKWVFVSIVITITTNGTAATSIKVTLPVNAVAGTLYVLAGRANNVSGKMLQGLIGTTDVTIYNYDNSYPGAGGELLTVSGWYEIA